MNVKMNTNFIKPSALLRVSQTKSNAVTIPDGYNAAYSDGSVARDWEGAVMRVPPEKRRKGNRIVQPTAGRGHYSALVLDTRMNVLQLNYG